MDDSVHGSADDPLVRQLVATRRVAVARSYVAEHTGGAAGARPLAGAPLVLDFDVSDARAFVAMARHPSGAITFHAPELLPARRGAAGRTPIRFTIHTTGARAESDDGTAARRGPITKLIRLVVMRVVRHASRELAGDVVEPLLEQLGRAWERSAWRGKPRGLVRVVSTNRALGLRKAIGRDAPMHRTATAPPRNLLLIHGTFSDVVGGFGALASATGSDGRRAFDALAAAYSGRIFGFNHYTIGDSPEENARALLAALPREPTQFDVLTHSRGALVLRTLLERQAALGADATRFQLGRAVLVAGPNEGTPLAAPARWTTLTSWLANLIDLFPDNPFTLGVSFLSEALGWMARHALGALPGLAAMTPGGPVISALEGAPSEFAELAALVSNCEPAGNVAARLADVGIDTFFGGANDLVVPTEGGWRIERPDGANVIAAGAIGCFGPGGNLVASSGAAVHHCNFFVQRESIDFIRHALAGEPVGRPAIDPASVLPWRRPALAAAVTASIAANVASAASAAAPARRSRRPTEAAPQDAALVPALEHSYVNRPAYGDGLHLLVVSPSVAQSRAAAATASADTELAHMLRAAERDDTAVIIAAFRNARVVEPFRKRGGAAGARWRAIIDARRAIDRHAAGDAAAPAATDAELARVGCMMFDTLFPGQIRRLYDAARSELRDRRLEVSFTSMIRWVADKPWELAYDPAREMFLCTEEINFVRNVFTAGPAESIPPRGGPLRILLVTAEPGSSPELSTSSEVASIEAAFGALDASHRAGRIEIDVMHGVTAAGLHARLERATEQRRPFDALHFIGHAEYRAKEGMGYIALDANGDAPRSGAGSRGAQLLAATTFREIITRRGIRLVFLNACDTGRGFGRADAAFAAGTAPFLIAGGVPAVVANQFPVLDRSAAAFAGHFYERLARGASIGDAMREARVAVRYLVAAEPIDWAVPVLFARNAGDRLV
jgi:hypothetical protein